MANWHFWGEKEFSDVYENIYIRGVMKDWFDIILEIVKEFNNLKRFSKKNILDVGCGEGHTTKQILDRIKGEYVCDLLEPNKKALKIAKDFLGKENYLGKSYFKTLVNFKTSKKYDIVFTSHTNYYWATNEKDYKNQLKKLISLVEKKGKLIILTLPEKSDHYNIMLNQVYPKFNYSKYLINFYRKLGLKVKVRKLKMKMYVGDILSTKKSFDLKTFYKFIHNVDSYPNNVETREFFKKIKKFQKHKYLNFKDELIIIEK